MPEPRDESRPWASITARPWSLPMREALEYWRQQVNLEPEDFYRLADELRGLAFTVGATARADMVQTVRDSLEKALESGQSFGAWKKVIREVIDKSGWDSARAEMIFRTNLQGAFQAGRYKQMQAAKALRPYWRYVAVQDSRTRPSHAALHGMVYHADHPFWRTFYPPNGFQCRCTVVSLSARDVRQRGYEVSEEWPGPTLVTDPRTGMETVISPMPDRGWESNQAEVAWKPDWSRYPGWMRDRLQK